MGLACKEGQDMAMREPSCPPTTFLLIVIVIFIDNSWQLSISVSGKMQFPTCPPTNFALRNTRHGSKFLMNNATSRTNMTLATVPQWCVLSTL